VLSTSTKSVEIQRAVALVKVIKKGINSKYGKTGPGEW
jgi:hypothetical protein